MPRRTFVITRGESTLETEVRSSVHPIHARSEELTGRVEGAFGDDGAPDLDEPHEGHVEVPVRSVLSGNRLNDAEMLRRAEAKRYPTLAFDVTGVTHDGGDRYRGTVTITAHGRTRSQEVPFQLALDGDRLDLRAEHAFDMRDFGLQPPRILTLKVEPEVRVSVHVVARERPQPR